MPQSTTQSNTECEKHCETLWNKKEINVTEYQRVQKNSVRHCENTVRYCGTKKNR